MLEPEESTRRAVGAESSADPEAQPVDWAVLRELRERLTRFLLEYKFGIDEVTTKLSILREEFANLHDYNPIEHISSRVKSPESLLDKVRGRDIPLTLGAIREAITDIAGIRVTCSFTSDVYRIAELLGAQPDIEVVETKDYIAEPKPNGYRSLHLLVQVPVHLSDRILPITVEVQLRTVAMDFWASLEHKIYYKYRAQVPEELLSDLKDAAETAASLDVRMERLHIQTHGEPGVGGGSGVPAVPDSLLQQLHELGALRAPDDSSE